MIFYASRIIKLMFDLDVLYTLWIIKTNILRRLVEYGSDSLNYECIIMCFLLFTAIYETI